MNKIVFVVFLIIVVTLLGGILLLNQTGEQKPNGDGGDTPSGSPIASNQTQSNSSSAANQTQSSLPTDANQTPSSSPSPANQTYNVEIAEFKWTSTWGAPYGVVAAIGFNITIHNLENSFVKGLTIEIRMLDINGTDLQAETMFYGPGIIGTSAYYEPFDGVLHAGEVRTLRGAICSDWDTMSDAWALGPVTTVVDVKMGEVVLDELRLTD